MLPHAGAGRSPSDQSDTAADAAIATKCTADPDVPASHFNDETGRAPAIHDDVEDRVYTICDMPVVDDNGQAIEELGRANIGAAWRRSQKIALSVAQPRAARLRTVLDCNCTGL